MPDEKIFVNENYVGEVVGNIYMTWRTPKKHFYIKGQGYPISTSILDRLKELGVTIIRIIEINRKDGRNKVYETMIEHYETATTFQENGYDEQKCCPLKRMVEVTKRGVLFDD